MKERRQPTLYKLYFKTLLQRWKKKKKDKLFENILDNQDFYRSNLP